MHAPLLARTVRVSGDSAGVAGRWGLRFPGGYVQLADPVVAHADGTVSRRLVRRAGVLPDSGVMALERVAFPSAPDLAVEMFPKLQVLKVDASLGQLPLWHLPAGASPCGRQVSERRTAFVGVHGRGTSPAEWLRTADACARSGVDWFSVSYRNDVGAPSDPDGLMHLGSRESDDLWSALSAVADLGFERVILAGVSLGGAVVANLLARHATLIGGRLWLPCPDLDSKLDPDIDRGWLVTDGEMPPLEVVGLMFEAPALDWPEIVALVASGLRLPRILSAPTVLLARLRTRLDPAALVPLASLDRLLTAAPPMLVVHGTDDAVVPVGVSDRLVAATPAAAYLRLGGVGHAQAFNLAHQRYFTAVSALLSAAA